jgi:hypothetical protein
MQLMVTVIAAGEFQKELKLWKYHYSPEQLMFQAPKSFKR